MTLDPATLLTEAELTIPRTPNELNAWLYRKIDYFAAIKNARSWVLLREGLAKKFYEELFPLNLLTKHLYGDREDVECTYRLIQGDFDALIVDYSTVPAAEVKVEITQAVNGHDQSLRMEYFVKHGHVPLTGHVSRKGTKNTGEPIVVAPECIDSTEKLNNTCMRIRSSLERKSVAKNGLGKYGLGHVLLLWFDDSMFRDTERAEVHRFIQQLLPEIPLNFRTLFVVGVPEGKTLFSFDLT
jgi:hypothetical protein